MLRPIEIVELGFEGYGECLGFRDADNESNLIIYLDRPLRLDIDGDHRQ